MLPSAEQQRHFDELNRQLAWLNAHFESGFANPVDKALCGLPGMKGTGWQRLDEVCYDFQRKRLSVLLERV